METTSSSSHCRDKSNSIGCCSACVEVEFGKVQSWCSMSNLVESVDGELGTNDSASSVSSSQLEVGYSVGLIVISVSKLLFVVVSASVDSADGGEYVGREHYLY